MPLVSKLTRSQMAAVIARDVECNSYVNLGIGMPTLVPAYMPEGAEIILHSENGIVGMAPLAAGQGIDGDLINASKEPISLAVGAAICDHVTSFAIMRGGHLDLTILGAFQVSEKGDLANWDTGATDAIPGVGGAMDLVVGAKKLFVMMEHVDKFGKPKIVKSCTYPITGMGVVDRIYTDLAVIDVISSGLCVHAMVEGMNIIDLQNITDAALSVSPECKLIELS